MAVHSSCQQTLSKGFSLELQADTHTETQCRASETKQLSVCVSVQVASRAVASFCGLSNI